MSAKPSSTLQALWNICDCLVDDLSTITSCEAFIIAALELAVNGCYEWVNSADYTQAVKTAKGD